MADTHGRTDPLSSGRRLAAETPLPWWSPAGNGARQARLLVVKYRTSAGNPPEVISTSAVATEEGCRWNEAMAANRRKLPWGVSDVIGETAKLDGDSPAHSGKSGKPPRISPLMSTIRKAYCTPECIFLQFRIQDLFIPGSL